MDRDPTGGDRRGRSLVRGPAHGPPCHGTDDRDHPEGIGGRSDAALARVLRSGALPESDGSGFLRDSSSARSDDDVRAVRSCLRSLPRQSGVSLRAFAREPGIKASTLSWWNRRFGTTLAEPAFVEVTVATALRPLPIRVGQVLVEVGRQTDRVPDRIRSADAALDLVLDGVRQTCRALRAAKDATHATLDAGDRSWVRAGDAEGCVELVPRFPAAAAAEVEPGACVAPTPSTVTSVRVAVGDRVEKGALRFPLEATKRGHWVVAPSAGVVVAVGAAVREGERLVRLEEELPAAARRGVRVALAIRTSQVGPEGVRAARRHLPRPGSRARNRDPRRDRAQRSAPAHRRRSGGFAPRPPGAPPGRGHRGPGRARAPGLVVGVDPVIHLDTHVVVWAYLGDLARLAPVRAVLDTATLGVSPMARLELQYLHGIGRLRVPAAVVVAELAETLGLDSTDASFAALATVAAGIGWTRDPFDRLIVANAIVDGVPLLTRDETTRAHFTGARWGRCANGDPQIRDRR